MSKAAAYLLRGRKPLSRFLHVAALPPDNNRSEAALRRVALGRKNYLFVGNEDAGKNVAGLYSLVASCELNGINPSAYLTDVMAKLSVESDIDELLARSLATVSRRLTAKRRQQRRPIQPRCKRVGGVVRRTVTSDRQPSQRPGRRALWPRSHDEGQHEQEPHTVPPPSGDLLVSIDPCAPGGSTRLDHDGVRRCPQKTSDFLKSFCDYLRGWFSR